MNVFIISPEVIENLESLANFASQKPNWWLANRSNWSPGDRREYTRRIGTHKVVFTWTFMPDGRLLRHLTISVGGNGKYPLPQSIFTAAHHLGFKHVEVDDSMATNEKSRFYKPGIEGLIQCDINKRDKCITVMEEVE